MAKLVIGLFLVFFLSSGAFGASFTSFPEGHWVYEAMGSLAETSVLDEAVPTTMNRFEAALLLSQAFQHMEQTDDEPYLRFGVSRPVTLADMVLQYNRSVPTNERMADDEVNWLTKLALEFEAELEVLGYALTEASNGRVSPFSSVPGLGYDPVVRENLRRPYLAASGGLLYGSGSIDTAFEEEAVSVSRDLRITEPAQRPDLNGINYSGLAMVPWNQPSSDDPTLGLIPISSDFLFGPRVVDDQATGQSQGGFAGQLLVAPGISLEGEVMADPEGNFANGTMSLGATVRLGEVEVGGLVRTNASDLGLVGSENLGTAYGLSVRLGDLVVNTTRDEQPSLTTVDQRQITTSLDLRYSLPNSAAITAGFRQTDGDLRSINELGAPSMTSVGFDLPIPSGRIRLGVASEWGLDPNRAAAANLDESGGGSESYSRTTTSLGLTYSFDTDTSFNLNYKLIDFSGFDGSTEEQKSNMATAEFTIRF